MLNLESWWPKAEGLSLGQKLRVAHDCGDGRNLIIERDGRGYHAHCFRCNDGGFQGPPAESLAERIRRLAALRAGDESISRGVQWGMPLPRVQEVDCWPEGAKVWLYKAGLGRAEIGELGVYYHPPSDRVVLPVFEGSTAVFFQARAYQKGRMPKYLGPTPKPPNLLPRWGRAAVPTLTEDILSAMKVGIVGEGWAIVGTSLSTHMVGELLKRKPPFINVWLDPDPPGRKAAAKICKQLTAYGLTPRNIVSLVDPKLHSRAEILEYLS